ncbi:DUF1149 family protein [Streptococcus sp. DD13]|uniref:DUF1149 family protein n=1 Tax=Streptococcus sp. DD13 TaxID=1777881 RepID=UPI00079569D4|nr:DUF1149 family protein [Streptococcus sp. DD13]KXT78840.1 hypothetical protein STRDD13_00372 [Streptococcus sp. DD13]
MKLNAEKVVVNAFHFDARSAKYEKENGKPQTKLRVNFKVLEQDQEENTTRIISYLTYTIVLNSFVISGTISQKSTIYVQTVDSPEDLKEQERALLAEPLLDYLKRLTYEVTEIAFDQPGINLEF